MTFAAPFFLLLLLPWAGVLAWVLVGRAEFARVSTTQFWDRTDTSTRTRRGIRRPPLAMVLLLLASLLATLAAAGIGVKWGTTSDAIWIVDRQLDTFARLEKDDALRRHLFEDGLAGTVKLVPDSNIVRATGEETTGQLEAAIAEAIATADRPIRVVTAKRLAVDASRVTLVAPDAELRNAGIERLAVVESPRPQAMVTVWNGTGESKAMLRVGALQQAIDLPPRGASRDYFVDAPAGAAEWVKAELLLDDDVPADNAAYVARRGAWPRIEAGVAVPPAVARFIDVYQQARPAAAGSPTVTISDRAVEGPALILAGGGPPAAGAIRAADHPITRHVAWDDLQQWLGASVNRSPPGGAALVWVGDTPVVTLAREGQVHVGFDLTAIAGRPEFVVFLTNVMDFLGAGRVEYASDPPRKIEAGWKSAEIDPMIEMDAAPGVYRTPDRLLAQNVDVVRVGDAYDQTRELADMKGASPRIVELNGLTLSLALVALFGAVASLTRS